MTSPPDTYAGLLHELARIISNLEVVFEDALKNNPGKVVPFSRKGVESVISILGQLSQGVAIMAEKAELP